MRDVSRESAKKLTNIARVGADLFSTKGFVETSMDDIAAAAKLSKGGLYHYFSSKTDLLDHIVQTFMDTVLTDLDEEIEKTGDRTERIKRFIFRHVRLYTQHVSEAKTLINEAHNLPTKTRKKVVVKEREYLRIAAGLVSDCFGGPLASGEATVITFNLLGMCNWIYTWYNPRGSISPERLSQMIFDLFISGISGLREKQDRPARG